MEKKNEKAKLDDKQLRKVSGGDINPYGTVVPDGLRCPQCAENWFLKEEGDRYYCTQCNLRFDRNGKIC